MLVLKRRDGQWIHVTHRSGDVLRVRLYDVARDDPGRAYAHLAFDDAPKNFRIVREECLAPAPAAPHEAPDGA